MIKVGFRRDNYLFHTAFVLQQRIAHATCNSIRRWSEMNSSLPRSIYNRCMKNDSSSFMSHTYWSRTQDIDIEPVWGKWNFFLLLVIHWPNSKPLPPTIKYGGHRITRRLSHTCDMFVWKDSHTKSWLVSTPVKWSNLSVGHVKIW